MLFKTESAALKPSKLINTAYDVMFLATAGITFTGALLFANSLDRISKAMLTTTTVGGLVCYTINGKASEKVRKVSTALETVQWESLKYQLKEEEELYKLDAEIQGASRKVDLIYKKSNPWEWIHWAQEAKVLPNMGPMQDMTREPIQQPQQFNERVAVPESNVNSIDSALVDSVVSPNEVAKLEELARAHPQHIRIDPQWLDELCDAASNPNMSKRYNHHFCITGQTQSGKSTIAGVIINKISAKSGKPATVIGCDPKDAITRWLCKFSYLFEGFDQINNWIKFAFNQADEQKKAYASNPKECGEMFFVQDEVDTVFGNGKGFLGFEGSNKKLQTEQAQKAQSLWNFLVKYTAGMKGHYIGLGQSPLSGDTGLSRPAYKSVCFIAMGNTVDYIFDNPSDFLRVNKEVQEHLSEAVDYMKGAGLRYALVVPMMGNPYVALVPEFDIEALQVSTTVNEVKTAPQDPNFKTLPQLEAELLEWSQSLDEFPSPPEVKAKWESLNGPKLSPKHFEELLRILGLVK